MWQPVWRAKVDSFSTVEACVEARVVGIWEGNHERSLLVHQPVHWDPACLQGDTLAIRCYHAFEKLQTYVMKNNNNDDYSNNNDNDDNNNNKSNNNA